MKKKLVITAMASVFFLGGCGPEEKAGDVPLKEETPISTQIMEKSKQAMEVVSETAEKVQKETVEKTNQLTDTVTEKTVALQKTAADMTTTVQGKVEDVMEVAKETASSLKEKTEESIAALVPDTQKSVEPSSTAAVATTGMDTVKKTAMSVAAPETVVLENKKGKITMPHKIHAEAYSCTTCHTDTKPGPITLGKEAGHALCKNCHTETGSGPTKCYDCHEKKPIKAFEGC